MERHLSQVKKIYIFIHETSLRTRQNAKDIRRGFDVLLRGGSGGGGGGGVIVVVITVAVVVVVVVVVGMVR